MVPWIADAMQCPSSRVRLARCLITVLDGELPSTLTQVDHQGRRDHQDPWPCSADPADDALLHASQAAFVHALQVNAWIAAAIVVAASIAAARILRNGSTPAGPDP